jgi:hypothetical protein
MSLTTTTVLGKRKSRATSETLLLQLSASESNNEHSDVSWQGPEPDAEFSRAPLNLGRKSGFILVNGSLVKNAKKRYQCTFSGCGKSYSKPCRLEEHERSHTGEVGVFVKNLRVRSRVFTWTIVDRSGRSCAQLAIKLIYGKPTYKPTLVLIYLIPIDPLSARKRIARSGFGLCNI